MYTDYSEIFKIKHVWKKTFLTRMDEHLMRVGSIPVYHGR